jgi:glycosyltransferase involved in cell wall biosynthesis
MKKEDPDVFIVNYWMTLFGPMYAIFSKGFKSNVLKIALIHNINPHEKRFFDSLFNRLFLNRYDAFVVLSERVKGDLLLKKPGASCLLLNHPSYSHFGVAIDKNTARERLNIPLNSKVLLFFGLIRDYKGLDVLLEAMNTLDETYYLIVAGEVYGDDQSYLKQIENIPQSHVVMHNGYIPDDEVKYYFSASDLCVLPYKKGTQSGVQAISDSFCTPVLVSENGGLHEKIEEGRSGFIIHQLEPTLLAGKIQDIFSGGKLDIVREKLKATLSNRGDEWKGFADQFYDFIQNEKLKKNI